MTARKKVVQVEVQVVSDHTAEVRGEGAYRVLERLKIPMQYQYRPISGGSRCWCIPARHAPDVVAMAEELGGSATVDMQQVML